MLQKDNSCVYLRSEAFDKDFVLVGGRLPVGKEDGIINIAISGGKIAWMGEGEIPERFSGARLIDLSGCVVLPGMMDLHTNLREPGREDEETILSGAAAAVAGGFTAIACLPNTEPVTDTEQKVRYIVQQSKDVPCKIYPIGAATKGLQGKELAPYYEMQQAGARGFSDGKHSITDSAMLKSAMNYAKMFDATYFCNCMDTDLSRNGLMNECEISDAMGMHGIPTVAEDIDISRHVFMAGYTKCKLHITRVSSASSVAIIEKYKDNRITVAVTPHHLCFNHEALADFNTNLKVTPPIRSEEDRQLLISYLKKGVIDTIVSDHAPHTSEEKDIEFENASFGVSGLETLVGAIFTELIDKNHIDITDFVRMMCVTPYEILGLRPPRLEVGETADISVISTERKWTVSSFYSKCSNSPFLGTEFKGRPVLTVVDGKIVYERFDK